jgi:quercetin dioxygenase-like cupin family protein
MTPSKERPRVPPAERFAGSEHEIDLASALDSLRKEEHGKKDNHRQMTVFRKDALRVILFAFEPGGRLPSHQAPGYVVIQTLNGSVRVRTQTETHELSAGRILILEPDAVHDVEAAERADMLLTISLLP